MAKNISTEKLAELGVNAGDLIREINESIQWVDHYLREEEPVKINRELKRYRRQLKNIRSVLSKKTVISLFGKSQVGKSYLVDGLLATKNQQDLMIPDRASGMEYRFIGDLNPPGGKESTGVVSRFSIDNADRATGMPIQIRLLSPKDVILILCDTYFGDIKFYGPNTETTAISAALPAIEHLATSAPQDYLTEDDIYDIKEYLHEYFSEKTFLKNYEDAGYWDKLAACIDRIPADKWSAALSLLWGNATRFTELFNLLISELKSLSFAPVVYTHFSALLVKDGSILDVARLFELKKERCEPLEVLAGNQRMRIMRSRLAALTYEVTIPIKEELADEKPFLKEVDLLDFPGARAREMADEGKLPGLDDEEFYNFYRRGKVAYLFNRYTKNYEISSLLFCIDNEQLEVKNLPYLLYRWIEHYIGSSMEERTRTLSAYSNGSGHAPNPLMIVFTKANLMLEYKPIDDHKKYDYKWETRFQSIFVKEYCNSYDWHDKWISNGNGVEKFKNLYLLRSFNYPVEIFEGYREHGRETGIAKSRVDYMQGMQQSFVSYPFNCDHFNDPPAGWEEFTSINKDGSEYIIRNLIPIANNVLRSKRYVDQLNAFKDKAVTNLSAHYRSDAKEDQIRAASRDGLEIHAIMNNIFGRDAYQFGSFIERFTLRETEVFKLYHTLLRDIGMVKAPAPKEYQLYREKSERLSSTKTPKENLEILRQDYNRDSLEETEALFKELNIDLEELFYGEKRRLKNNSEVLAEGARDYWFSTRLNPDNFQSFIAQGFKQPLLVKLLENFKLNFNRLQITKVIAAHIRRYADTIQRIDDAEELLAHVTAGIINEFINSAGWTFYSNAEKQKMMDANVSHNLKLIFPDDPAVFQSLEKLNGDTPDELTVERLIDFMDHLSENLNRIPIDVETIRKIPMIKHYRRWRELMQISFIANCDIPNYDPEGNRLLGLVLERIRKIDFTLTERVIEQHVNI